MGDGVLPHIDRTESQIRLLRIQPGSFSDPLRIDVFAQDLKDKPKYEALSYAWGGKVLGFTILVNGTEFPVSANLAAALQHLRHETEERTMWVDAICINQKVSAERNHQVKLMGKIYSSAHRVVVWLGVAGEDSDFVLSTISQGDPHVSLNSLRFRFGLRALCARDWFSRIWVVQEVALAHGVPEMVCGFKRISWSIFVPFISKAWSIIDEELKKSESPYRNFGIFREKFAGFASNKEGATALRNANRGLSRLRGNHQMWDKHHQMWENSDQQFREQAWQFGKHDIQRSSVALHELISQILDLEHMRTIRPYSWIETQIYRTRKHMATDPRDKIYALLGISNFQGPPIVPDYALSVRRVFLRAVKDMMLHNLEYLYSSFPLRPYHAHSGLHPHDMQSSFWPTWVPDLSGDKLLRAKYDVSEICPSYELIRPLVEKLRDKTPPVRFCAKDTVVTTWGNPLGKILFVRKLSFTDVYEIPHELRELNTAFRDHSIPPHVALDAIMAHNGQYKTLKLVDRERVVGRFENLLNLLYSQPDLEFTCYDDFRDVCDMIANSHCRHGREVFITDKGHVGIAPCYELKDGDTLAGLFTINFPMILRSRRCGHCGEVSDTMVCVAHVACHQWGHSLPRGTSGFPFTPFAIS